MAHHNGIDDTTLPTFSPAHFRDAMGPGYQVATFAEQQILSASAIDSGPYSLRPPSPSPLLTAIFRAISARSRRRNGRRVSARGAQVATARLLALRFASPTRRQRRSCC